MKSHCGTLALALLLACGGQSPCPPGYERHGGVCEPVKEVRPPADLAHDEAAVDVAVPDPGSGEVTVEVQPQDTAQDIALPPEVASVDAWPGGIVGKGCKKDDDCAGTDLAAVCLDWLKGYCSVTGCGPSGVQCPVGSVCMPMTASTSACAVTCASDSDCRTEDGYACKALPDLSGAGVRVCWQVKVKGGPGAPCQGAKDCAGAADCLTNFDGGYCAVRWCRADWPCPDGALCVKLNGVPTCMKTCGADVDCAVEGALRACMELKSASTGEKVKVCGSGTKGVPLGGVCRNDSECTSFQCFIAYTGHCSLTKTLMCKLTEDCPGGEICIPTPEDTFGYCTKSCNQTCQAPNLGYCIGGPEEGKGECLPPCQKPLDPACNSKAGLACMFGDPIGETGRYACAHLSPGAVGAVCTSDADCHSGQCLVGPDGGGYCTSPCGFAGYCPFPTRCQTVLGQSRCLLRCMSSEDCPKGLFCSVPNGATLDVCYLP